MPTLSSSATVRLGALAFLIWCGAPAARAQEDEDSAERRAYDAFEEAIEEGRDRVVLDLAEERLAKNPRDVAAWTSVVDAAENVGDFPRALRAAEAWLGLAPDAPAARHALLRILRRRGDLAAVATRAEPWLRAASPEPDGTPAFDLGAAAIAAAALVEQGRDADADRLFDRIVAEGRRIVVREPHDLAALSEAYLHFGGRKGVDLAEEVLIEAQKKRPHDARLSLRLARLYWDHKFLPGDAVAETQAALKARPNYADALQYQASVLREWTNAERAGERAAEAATWCLDVHPEHADALADAAFRRLSDFQVEEGEKLLDRALKAEPRNLRVMALQAAAAYLAGRRDDAEKIFAAVLALDPTYGEGRRQLALLLHERRRWPEALEQVEAAAKIDPRSPRIWDDVARFSLFLAQTPKGLAALEKANEISAYNQPWRRNMELVLDTMRRRYVAVETERFLVRVSEKEKPALRRFYGPFFDRSFDLLSKKYGYVPDGAAEAGGRVTIEMFDDASDFSARTFGYVYPGFLGVCFGPLVTLNGPRALPAAVNSWARTFHHEFAHSITVGLAKGRMPRWLTEGLSTYEEFSFEPSWTRGMDRELFDAYATDDLCRVSDFDRHFRGPRVVYAYFQAGEVAAMLVRRYGMERVVALLRAYGDDLGTSAAFRKALGVSPEDVDRLFREETAARFAGVRLEPRYSPEAAERAEAAWRKNPADRDASIRRAAALAGSGRLADAESALAECARRGVTDDRLERLRALSAFRRGKVAEGEEIRRALAERGYVEFALEYAGAVAALKAKKKDEAERLLRSAIAAFPTYPGDPQGGPEAAAPRTLLYKLLKDDGRKDEAMAVAEEHLRLKSEELELRKELVAWRLSRGEKAEARRLLDLHVLIDARDPRAHSDRGRLQLEAGEADPALASAETALIALEGKKDGAEARADARVLAAEALLALGRAEEARSMLREALSEAPSHPAAKRLAEEAAGVADRPVAPPVEEKGRPK